MTMKIQFLKKNLASFLAKPSILLLILISVSIFPRLWQLESSPPVIVDEPANILDINSMQQDGINITDFHWDFSKSRIVHLLPLGLIKLGVEDKFLALRYSSVIISILALIPFFYIILLYANKLIAFSTTLLFSYSYYFLQFSRVGWTDVILNIFLGLLLFLLLVRIKSEEGKVMILSVMAGLVAAILFYSYRSSIILLLVSLIFLIAKKTNRNNFKLYTLNIFLYVISFLIFSFPWIMTIKNYPEKYNLRLNSVSINTIEFPNIIFNSKFDLIVFQSVKTINSWVLLNRQYGSGYEDQRYLPQGYPIVNVFIKLGFWAGIVFGFLEIKKTYPLYFIIILGLLGQIFTVNPPNGARGLIMLPCIYILFAIGVSKITVLLHQPKIVFLSLLFLSILFSIQDFYFYRFWMSWITV